MDPKKMGAFLKQLRNEKRITQEQLAEILGVSGRTVSRWETGANLPDLSVLVRISEYYNVQLEEILNGERKNRSSDSELKETLLKVADYNELERQGAARSGNISFSIMLLVCAMTIIVQMLMTGNLSLVVGETAALLAGGLVYVFLTVVYGAWNGSWIKSAPGKDFMISLICAGVFSAVLYLMLRKHTAEPKAVCMAICFFAVLSAISYALLRGLSRLSQRKLHKYKDENTE